VTLCDAPLPDDDLALTKLEALAFPSASSPVCLSCWAPGNLGFLKQNAPAPELGLLASSTPLCSSSPAPRKGISCFAGATFETLNAAPISTRCHGHFLGPLCYTPLDASAVQAQPCLLELFGPSPLALASAHQTHVRLLCWSPLASVHFVQDTTAVRVAILVG